MGAQCPHRVHRVPGPAAPGRGLPPASTSHYRDHLAIYRRLTVTLKRPRCPIDGVLQGSRDACIVFWRGQKQSIGPSDRLLQSLYLRRVPSLFEISVVERDPSQVERLDCQVRWLELMCGSNEPPVVRPFPKTARDAILLLAIPVFVVMALSLRLPGATKPAVVEGTVSVQPEPQAATNWVADCSVPWMPGCKEAVAEDKAAAVAGT